MLLSRISHLRPTDPDRVGLFAFDVDGTLARNGVMAPCVEPLFDMIRTANMEPIIVTDRSVFELDPILRLFQCPVSALCSGGVVEKNCQGAASVLIDAGIVPLGVVHLVGNFGLPVVAEGVESWSVSDASMVPFSRIVLGLPLSIQTAWPPNFDVVRLVTRTDHRLNKIESIVRRQFDMTFDTWHDLPVSVIRSPFCDKGLALSTYAKQKGVPMRLICAAGNDVPDISMFKVAAWSIAINASNSSVRAAAHECFPSIDELLQWISKCQQL